jgi:uncharacterized protein (DUF885 family)
MDEIRLRYKVGQAKMCRLNNYTEQKLGVKLNLREIHIQSWSQNRTSS